MTINCNGQLIDLSIPRVMGIVNITPDSFYDGGKLKSDKTILLKVEQLLKDGATFIDVGGYSSRPQAKNVSESEELQRVIPVIRLLREKFTDSLISIDTFRSTVAQQAVVYGACMVNDISAGLLDPNMLKIVGELQIPYIMMHMKGTPQTMQNHTAYKDLIHEMLYYFSERLETARKHHIVDVVLDPGFGFAKTTAQNFALLEQLNLLKLAEKPMLVGLSRKSMIYKTLEISPQEALNGTTVLHTLALEKGACILRVHDVKE